MTCQHCNECIFSSRLNSLLKENTDRSKAHHHAILLKLQGAESSWEVQNKVNITLLMYFFVGVCSNSFTTITKLYIYIIYIQVGV